MNQIYILKDKLKMQVLCMKMTHPGLIIPAIIGSKHSRSILCLVDSKTGCVCRNMQVQQLKRKTMMMVMGRALQGLSESAPRGCVCSRLPPPSARFTTFSYPPKTEGVGEGWER